ncbi:MAG: exosortase-associated EpsI family protein [Nitrospiraceae bacterium]|nr:MAG: exosortase-associated EpsI family protein [Nitrospiraceae bacterium]
MTYKRKTFIVIFLLISTVLSSYIIPETKYTGTKFISELKIPLTFPGWNGKDVTGALNINYEESTYNFINDALGYQYINQDGKSLLFIILDAGNLHNPRVCFTNSGYMINELEDTEFTVSNRTFKAHALFTQNGGNSFLSFYWVIIDKNIANEWIENKIKQLYFSLFNAKRVGLMVRIDIPANEHEIEEAIIMGNEFVHDLSLSLESTQSDYIFGEK